MSERQDTRDVSLSVKHEEDVSPESLAWADSCIISFPDDSDNNDWETFRDALTEIIDIHPQMFVPTETTTSTTSVRSRDEVMTEAESVQIPLAADSSSSEQVSEIVSLLNFELDPSKNSLQDHYFPAENRTTNGPVDNHTTSIESIEVDDSVSNGIEEEDEEPESETPQVFKDDFMSSSYIEDNNADEVDVLEDPGKLTPQEIFKVWDLKIVGDDDDEEEEDGLGLQVKKALDESSTVQLHNDDDLVVVEKSYIDDLIAGITDLSLTETFE